MPARKDTKKKLIYFKPDEWDIVCKRAKALNMRPGTYIREIAVRGEIKHYDMAQLNNLRMSFNRIGTLIDQIAKVANSTQSIFRKDIEDMQKQMDYFARVMENYLSVLEPDYTI